MKLTNTPMPMAMLGIVTSAVLGLSSAALAQTAQEQQTAQEEQQPPPMLTLPGIEVIGVTPLHGIGIAKDKFPANVQTLDSEEIEEAHSTGLGELMNTHMASVYITEAQNSTLQPNVSYRGYTVSPLLGLPQGLAVYQDGVRINEPFGDTMLFSLIPQSAVSSVELVPGSNPAFGRNALGGALSITTKSGLTDPGIGGEMYYGSFDRQLLQLQAGGQQGPFDYFFTGEYFSEDGWRDYSPSRAKRMFGKVGWSDEKTRLALSLAAADVSLIGNGTLPVQLLETDRSAIFTRPDLTESSMWMLNLTGNRELTDDIIVSGNVFYRSNDIDTRNGDDSDYEACDTNPAILCDDDGIVHTPSGSTIPPMFRGHELDGTNNYSSTEQDSYGANLQVTFLQDFFVGENQLVVGAAFDNSDVDFGSRSELGYLDATRLAVRTPYIDGDSFVNVNASTHNYGLYFSDTWSITQALDVTFSGRYNHTRIKLDDRLGTSLNGEHTYDHFNPAVGVVYEFMPELSTYARYSVSNRAPTPMELTCADPNDPCRLPNDFVSDPPLDQVVAKTVEIGARGHLNGASPTWQMDWTLALFSTVNHDDIYFISTPPLQNTGYFTNIGETRRRGVELTLHGSYRKLDWFLGYTYLDAEFRESFEVPSANHPYADAQGRIQVESGNRIPVTPEHLFKIGADYNFTPKFKLGATLLYESDRYLRGDEANLLDTIDGFAVVNLRGQYQVTDDVSLFARVNNVFNEEYATFGGLGEADEVLGPAYDSPRFLSPSAPRTAWVGVQALF